MPSLFALLATTAVMIAGSAAPGGLGPWEPGGAAAPVESPVQGDGQAGGASAQTGAEKDPSGQAATGEEPLLGPEGVKAWEVGGFIDTNYSYNSNQPDNHVYRGTSVQPRTGEFSLSHIVAYLRRDPTPGRTSLRMELAVQAGPAADALVAYDPNPGGANGKYAGPEVWKHLSRANIGVRTRSGFEIVGGLQLSPVGIGLHWNPYNWNYTVTWQLNSVPYYLQGIRLAQTIRERHQIQLWITNGWQILSDNNRAPSAMLGYVFAASPRFSLAEYVWVGPEQADMRPQAWRLFSDSQFTFDSERFGIAGLFDVGADPRTDLPGRPWHMWMSAALFTRWHVLGERHTWDMAARPEFFWDRDGRVFGVPQTLVAGTYTNSFRVLTHLLLRLEYRYDWSSSETGFFYRGPAIADDAPGLSRQQHTVFFSVAGVFAHRFGGRRR